MNLDTTGLEQDLRAAARNLADSYHQLREAAWEKQSIKLARKTEPHFGPMSPIPDGDWALDIEMSLLYETSDDKVPGGLIVMAADALQHAGHTTPLGQDHQGRTIPITGGIICAHIARNAYAIAEKFPAAHDLLDLMRNQDDHIGKQLARRFPEPKPIPTVETRHGSTTIIRMMAGKGHRITRDQLRYWADQGHITRAIMPNKRSGYLLSEVLHHVIGEGRQA